jgi:hypothetical protein
MTEILPIPPAVPDADAQDVVAGADAVLAARALREGDRIAGLIAAAELDTVGSPRKLPMDLWPDADPELVAEVWARALVVGVRAGRFMSAPRFYRDKLASLQGRLAEAGYRAMGKAAEPAVVAAYRSPEWHPVDVEEEREH